MARLERHLNGNFNALLHHIHEGIIGGSVSASFEDGSDWSDGDTQVAVRVYERYSWLGGNRVSLSMTLVSNGPRLFLSAITSGGSQAVFFKINRFGEDSFLGKLDTLLAGYRG